MAQEEKVIIVGSGPAGLTAAIYAARSNLKPLLFEGFMAGGMPGGQLMETNDVENFPGYPDPVNGQALMADIKKQAENAGTRFIMEDIDTIRKEKDTFILTSMNDEEYSAQAVIVATGARARRLPLESEKKFWGRGISACAVCDGALPMFRNKPIAVVGGGEAAIEEAIHLTQFASRVYIIHRRDELRATAVMEKRVFSNDNIEVLWNKVVEEFQGEDTLETIVLKDTQTGELSNLSVGGCFEAIGHIPNTKFLRDLAPLDEQGYLTTLGKTTITEVEGLFAAGDVQDTVYKQAITSAGTGCMAAMDAEKYIGEKFGD
ncbi:MAG: thioredoxin-disulfide reductase [Fibrobacterota bacterium]